MNLRQVEAFRAVIETRSMTEAADRMRISQPNISRLVSDLERSIGFRLFERLPGRRLVATDDAIALHTEVERSFIALSRIQQAAREIRSFGKGRVRIAASTGIGHRLAPTAIKLFRAKFPETALTLEMVNASTVLMMIASQQAEMGVIGNAPDLVGFERELLLNARGACIVPASHPLSSRAVIRPKDMEGVSFISYPLEDQVRHRIDKLFSEKKINRVLAIETRFTETICALAAEGVGVSIVNPIIAGRLLDERIKLVRFSVDFPFSCQLIFPAKRPRGRLTQYLAECFREASRQLFPAIEGVKVVG